MEKYNRKTETYQIITVRLVQNVELLHAAHPGEHHIDHPRLVGTGDVDDQVLGLRHSLTLEI